MTKLVALDYIVIILFLGTMVVMGMALSRRVKSSKSFYTANNSIGMFGMLATACATMVGGSSMIGRAGLGFTSGIECLNTVFAYMAGMFIFSAFAGKIYDMGIRHDLHSIPALLEYRFGKPSKLVVSVMIVVAMTGGVAAQISATATMIRLLGNDIGISYEMGAVISTLVFMLYTSSSGLYAVVYTDMIQFIILIICIYTFVPLAGFHALGGIGNFVAHIDPAYVKPVLNGHIISDILGFFIFSIASADMWQRAFSAKNRATAGRGMALGTVAYFVCMVLVFLMALIARQLIPNVKELYGSTDAVIPALAVRLLPSGILGLCIAGILSVTMSSADSSLLAASQAVADDIYSTLRPGEDCRRLLLASRIATVVISIFALLSALYMRNAYDIISKAFSVYSTSAGACVFGALFWRKQTSQGTIASLLGGLLTCIIWNLMGSPFGIGATIPGVAVSALLLVTVSLATCQKPAPDEAA